MGRGETRANDDDGVRKEKAKGKEKKQEREREREGVKKFCFPQLQMKIIFIRDTYKYAMRERETK